MSENGSDGKSSHDGFKMLKPTYAFGAMGPSDPIDPRPTPSWEETKARPLVAAALNIKDPWAGANLPSLHSSDATHE